MLIAYFECGSIKSRITNLVDNLIPLLTTNSDLDGLFHQAS